MRRGSQLAHGAALVHHDGGPALLVNRPVHGVGIFLLALSGRGWCTLADWCAPTRWVGGDLFAQPRESPVLVSRSRAAKAGLVGIAAREGSTSVEVGARGPVWLGSGTGP